MSNTIESLLDPLMLGALAASFAFLWVIWKLLTAPTDSDREAPGPEDDDPQEPSGGARGREGPSAGSARRSDESER
jgi:hypothetical protein